MIFAGSDRSAVAKTATQQPVTTAYAQQLEPGGPGSRADEQHVAARLGRTGGTVKWAYLAVSRAGGAVSLFERLDGVQPHLFALCILTFGAPFILLGNDTRLGRVVLATPMVAASISLLELLMVRPASPGSMGDAIEDREVVQSNSGTPFSRWPELWTDNSNRNRSWRNTS